MPADAYDGHYRRGQPGHGHEGHYRRGPPGPYQQNRRSPPEGDQRVPNAVD
jgi:hypothetical protein